MINPINISTNPICYQKTPVNQTSNPQVLQQDNFELSNYKSAQAILVRNNISFKNLVMPIEITDKYNKKSEGMEHLDLPNIHVYEYPDTNLQVIINSVSNNANKNKIQSSLSLYDKGIVNNSSIKKSLLMELIKEKLNKNNIQASLNEDYDTFINIDFQSNTSDLQKIKLINKIITSPKFTEQDLKKCQKTLINKLNSKKYQKATAEIKQIIGESLLNSKDETIKNIQNLSLEDIETYYLEILKNSEAQYAVTVDKSFLEHNRNSFYSIFNSGISNKFQKTSERKLINARPIFNNKNILIYDDDNNAYLTFHYPVMVASNRDKLIYRYLELLEFFWREPYISEESSSQKYIQPIELKNNKNDFSNSGFIEFKFKPTGKEKISSNEQAIETFRAIIETLYDEKLASNTLESIKNNDKEIFEDILNKNYDSNRTHELLKMYKNDIFKIYETIDSISIEDLRDSMKQILFAQQPIIIINEDLNPYKN